MTAAIAFAVSITRPPPRATRLLGVAPLEDRRAASGTPPGATSWTAVGGARRAPGASASRRGVLSSSKDSKPCSRERSPRQSARPGAEDDGARRVPPDEVRLSGQASPSPLCAG